jgi:uncharacterized membrane protein (UPF0127 family)
MMKTTLTLMLTLAFFLPLIGCSGGKSKEAAVQIEKGRWTVELALTDAARTHGLSDRDRLEPGTGMLFAFPRPEASEFWMKDCHFPIDVAFITDAMEVAKIWTMPVEPDPHDPQALYPSNGPISFALEVNGGELAKFGVHVGSKVTLEGKAQDAAKDAR